MTQFVQTQIRDQEIWLANHTYSLHHWTSWSSEPENLDFIDSLQVGEVFLDLGACEGRFSLYAAKKGIQTIAVEPELTNFLTLLANINRNGLLGEKVRAVNKAVGASNHISKMVMQVKEAGAHNKRVDQTSRSDLSFPTLETQEVEVVTCDSEFANQLVTAIKVDVDGSEKEFLAGTTQILSRPEVKNLMFELCYADPSFEEIVRKLYRLGFQLYKEFPIEKDLYNVWFKK